MKTVLLTGFEPFAGRTRNASAEVTRALHDTTIARHAIVGVILPCVFGRSIEQLIGQIEQHQPSLVVCLGEVSGRRLVTPERVAINLDDARIADNAGQQPVDRQIVAEGPAAYFSTLPVKAMSAAIRARGIPAEVSYTAGTFVCNHLFYGLMHELTRRSEGPAIRGGFIHVPSRGPASRSGSSPSVEAIRAAIETAIRLRPGRARAGQAVTGRRR